MGAETFIMVVSKVQFCPTIKTKPWQTLAGECETVLSASFFNSTSC